MVAAFVDAAVVHEQSGGGADGEGLDGVEGGGGAGDVVVADAAFELVPELGQLLEVALQGALADAELSGEVGGGAGARGQERGEEQEAGGLVRSAGGRLGVRVRRGRVPRWSCRSGLALRAPCWWCAARQSAHECGDVPGPARQRPRRQQLGERSEGTIASCSPPIVMAFLVPAGTKR